MFPILRTGAISTSILPGQVLRIHIASGDLSKSQQIWSTWFNTEKPRVPKHAEAKFQVTRQVADPKTIAGLVWLQGLNLGPFRLQAGKGWYVFLEGTLF